MRSVAFFLLAVPAAALLGCGDDGGGDGSLGTGTTGSGTTAGSTDVAGTVSSSASSSTSTTGGTTSGSSSGEVTGDPESSSSSGTPYIPIDCTDSCADTATDAGIAVCYACRCKNAMEGYMPSVDELQCSQAEELIIYTADLSGPDPQLVPADGDNPTCANPALLTESCASGSRLGQIQEGSVFVKWVCRDPTGGVFSDVGVIMYNARTGASCWFDDVDNVTGNDDLPALDLLEGDAENLENYLSKFYFTDGDSCTRDCHDADPFLYTPYFESIEWQTGAFALGPHARVELDGTYGAVDATYLDVPEVVMCATCHRLGSAAGCDFLSPDAMGDYKGPAHEQAIVDATDPGSPNWSLAYWMPSNIRIPTLDAWDEVYGPAKARINACCQSPGVNSANCNWVPLPTE